MPIRMAVGNSEGVTNPSMKPATTKQATRPITMTTERSPASLSAAARVRSPGAMIAHDSCSPAPPATRIDAISSRPWGRISPQNWGPSPAWCMTAPITPTLSPLLNRTDTGPSTGTTPRAKVRNATKALLTVTCPAKF